MQKLTSASAIGVLLMTVAFAPSMLAADGSAVKTSAIMDNDRDKVFDNLESVLRNLDPGEQVSAIVLFDGVTAEEGAERMKRDAGDFTVTHSFKWPSGIAAELTRAQIYDAAKQDYVLQAEKNGEVSTNLATATESFGTDAATADFGVDGDRDGDPALYTKEDVTVAVVDTGIDSTHLDLDGGKVICWYDAITGQPLAYDDNGHGTHVASTAAGTGEASDGKHAGVAPGASLVGVKVLNALGVGSFADVIEGINWVIDNKDRCGVDIMSLSLGAAQNGDGTGAEARALDAAVDAGLTVTVAAGNSGPMEGTLGLPADAFDVISVGAGIDLGEQGFGLAWFSSRGYTLDGRVKPEIVAPGWEITAAAADTLAGYATYSGTSMATPFTAGVAALMLDANPSLTPAQVKTAIMDTAHAWGQGGVNIDYGAGLLDGHAAVAAAAGATGSGTPPARPSHAYAEDRLAGTGDVDAYHVDITDTSFPFAGTMQVANFKSGSLTTSATPDFDVLVYNPDGTLVAEATYDDRQVEFCEPCGSSGTTVGDLVPGTYVVEVHSKEGAGDYFIDFSGGFTTVTHATGEAATGTADVDSLTLTKEVKGNGKNVNVIATTTVVDGNGNPLPDARVLVDFTLPDGSAEFGYGYTGTDGTVSLKVRVSGLTGTVTADVREVLKVDHPWTGQTASASITV